MIISDETLRDSGQLAAPRFSSQKPQIRQYDTPNYTFINYSSFTYTKRILFQSMAKFTKYLYFSFECTDFVLKIYMVHTKISVTF